MRKCRMYVERKAKGVEWKVVNVEERQRKKIKQ